MKKIYLLVFCASFFVGNAQINWQRSQAASNYPTWMGTGDTERGMAYHATNDHMYVVTRLGNKINVVNGADGSDLTDVANYTGVGGGTFTLNDVEVSTNGSILACNLTVTPSLTSKFKIYKWDSENATPSVYAEYPNDASDPIFRLGDVFTVAGDISTNAVIFAGARSSDKIVRWIVTAGAIGAPTVITLADVQGTNTVAYPKTISANPQMLVKSYGKTLRLYNADGTYANEEVSASVLGGTATDFEYFVLGGKEYIAIYSSIAEQATLLDVTGGLGNAATISRTPKLGTNSNVNGAGGVGVKTELDMVDGINNTITVYTLATNNGISGTTLVYQGAVLSNKKFSVSAANIYPNPASDEFQITLSNAVEKNAEATIYDINGRQVKSSKLISKLQSISIADLSKGLYVVKIKNGDSQSTSKLLKN
uniref:T9SS type A sorting domain-containing protein n=1 Tax=Mariniflexile sp. TaxID=1979402 RepID=UPI0040488D0B